MREPLIKPGYATVIASTGVSPGPASGIKYTVRYTTQDGDLPDMVNQIPTQRWTATDVVAHPRGFQFPIVIVGDRIVGFFPPEQPHVTECEG